MSHSKINPDSSALDSLKAPETTTSALESNDRNVNVAQLNFEFRYLPPTIFQSYVPSINGHDVAYGSNYPRPVAQTVQSTVA
jgi:hypothetical protein